MANRYLANYKLLLAFLITLLAFNNAKAQYCTTGLYSYGCYYNDYINSVSTTGGSTNISNLFSGCGSSWVGYSNYGSTYGTLTVAQNTTFNITIVNTPNYTEYYKVFIDFNADGDFFDAGETVLTVSAVPAGATVGGGPQTISVPLGATVGATRMRVRCVYGSLPVDACSYQYGGEVEDYNVTIVAGCATSVTSQPSNVSGLCAPTGASFTIAATGGVSYAWQESQNGGATWANLSNSGVYSGTNTTTMSISASSIPMNNYQYRCVVVGATCSAVSNAATLSIGTPGVVSSTPGTACFGSSGTVSVVPTPGGTVNWYTALTGGSLLGTGNSYTVPSVTSAATYYADVTAPPVAYTFTNCGTTSNGQYGAMCDFKALNNITLTGFDAIPTVASTYTFQVYYKLGTHVGFESNSAAWTLLGTLTTGTTSNVPVTINFSTTPALTANTTYAIYVVANVQSIRYWNATTVVGTTWCTGTDIETYVGKGSTGTFGGTISQRCLGGTFRYTKGSSCSPLGRTGVNMTLNTLPSLTGSPTNVTICSGQSTNFGASATGTGIAYQWQQSTDGGVTWNNLSNGGVYNNVTTSTLSLAGVPVSMNNYRFRCYMPGTCSPAATSTSATLTVNASPAIANHPANTSACPNGNPSFTVIATGLGLTYQWQENNGGGFVNLTNTGIYSNVTTATLNITGAPVGMNGYTYKCIVGGACAPTQTSNIATLSISATIPITQQPQLSQICVGTNANFAVNAVGSSIAYQWQQSTDGGFTWANVSNGGVYANVTTSTLTLVGAPLSYSNYLYRCVVSNPCVAPFLTSAAMLVVDASPSITAQPQPQTTCAGTAVSFTVGAVGGGLVYQWQASPTGIGGPYSNVTSVQPYSGPFSSTLTLVASPATHNGYAFRCVVGGNCAPSVISAGAVVTINGLPTITSQPAPSIICLGNNASFTVGATGTALQYQWQQSSTTGYNNITNGGIYSGANAATLVLTAPPASMTGTDFRCYISGACTPAVITQTQTMLVNTPPTITGQPSDLSLCVGNNGSFTVQATAQVSSPMLYQWQVNDGTGFQNALNSAPYSGVTTNVLNITNANVLMNGYSYRCIITSNCSPFATSAITKLTVNTLPAVTQHPSDVTLCPQSIATFTVAGTGTALVYRWQVNTGASYVNITDNNTYSGSNTNVLQVQTAVTMNNYLYRCVLTGICPPPAISNGARLSVLNPVVIQSNTLTDTVCEGGTLKFGVAATGANLRYQWQRKLTTGGYIDLRDIPPYSGVNTDSLRFSGAPDSIAGYSYRCRVYETQLCNLSFYTPDIPLGMFFAPQTNPAFLKVGPLKTATFAVPLGGSKYQWQVNKNDGAGYVDLTNSGPYSGTSTNTLFISPTQYTMNEYKFRCVIDSICKTPVASKNSVLNVDPQLTVSSIGGKSAGLTVYPNPLEGTKLNISISTPLKGNTEVKVMDKMGKVVYTSKLDYNKQLTNSIELNALAAGVYTLQVINESESVIESVRFTKQ